MDKISQYFSKLYSRTPFWWVLLGFASVEVLSFAAFQFLLLNQLVFAVLVIGIFALSLYKLHYGILAVFAELVVGSKGYLFFFLVGDTRISIRMGIFAAVCLAYLYWISKEKRIRFFEWTLWKPYVVLGIIILLGASIGYARGNAASNIFFDMNGYLYFALIAPLTQSIRSSHDIHRILAIVFVGVLASIIKTLVLLFIFSHMELWPYSAAGIYRWVRDSGVGEITRMPSGFVRIFFQSHMYVVYLFFFIGTWFAVHWQRSTWRSPIARRTYLFWLAMMLTLFLIYSRSFWVGSVATILIAFAWFLFIERMRVRRLLTLGAACIVTFALGYVIALGIVNFPLPGVQPIDAEALLTDRTKNLTSESAASSRLQLLKPLFNAAMQHPVIGSGLGTTVTYISADPRILEQNPTGEYTTYAFEWGYLDFWLKFGLVGLVVFGYLAICIIAYAFRSLHAEGERRVETLGLLFTFIALLATHFFTPYMNHPLGIGWILLLSLFFTMDVEKTEEPAPLTVTQPLPTPEPTPL